MMTIYFAKPWPGICLITVPIELFLKYLIHKSPIAETILGFLKKIDHQ